MFLILTPVAPTMASSYLFRYEGTAQASIKLIPQIHFVARCAKPITKPPKNQMEGLGVNPSYQLRKRGTLTVLLRLSLTRIIVKKNRKENFRTLLTQILKLGAENYFIKFSTA